MLSSNQPTGGLPEQPTGGQPVTTGNQPAGSSIQPETLPNEAIFRKGYNNGLEIGAERERRKFADILKSAGINPDDVEGSIAELAPTKPAEGKMTLASLQKMLADERLERVKEKTTYEQNIKNERLRNEIRGAIASVGNAYNAEDVVELFKAKHEFEDVDGRVVIKRNGVPLIDTNANYMGIGDAVKKWATSEYMHLFKASGAGGVGISGQPGGSGLDLKRIEAGDVAYIREHQKEIDNLIKQKA